MKLEDLEARLGTSLSEDWARFQERSPGEDTVAFLGWLHGEDRVGTGTFVEILTTSHLELGDVDVPDAAASRRVLGVVGEGAMGAVQVVRDDALGRTIALKQMVPAAASNPRMVRRFVHEAKITAQLDHPGIIPIHGLESDESGPAYAMKLVRGRTFRELVDECRALYEAGKELPEEIALPDRVEAFLEVCNAMHYAHTRGVIHRDIKPENLMLGPFHEVYVVDWGIAKILGESEDVQETLDIENAWAQMTMQTQVGQVIGTVGYMSPEQARGENNGLDTTSDQYALGLVLRELVTLDRPFGNAKAIMLRLKNQEGDLEAVRHAFGKSLDPDLCAVIDKATAQEPGDRYPDVEAFADDLRRWQRGDATLARPDTVVRGMARALARQRHLALALLATLVALVVAILTVSIVSMEAREREAYHREQQLTRVLGTVSDQANAIDRELLRLQGLLGQLSAAANQAVLHGQELEGTIPLADAWDRGERPTDVRRVDGYPTHPVSFSTPVVKLAPEVSLQTVEGLVRRLLHVGPVFREVAVASDPSEGPAQERLRAGVPIVWSYVALQEGVHVAYPGHGGYAPSYDPRQRPWYREGVQVRSPTWGKPYEDASGMGWILPCVTGIYEEERLLGVSGIELTIDRVVTRWLAPPPGARDVALVDSEGVVIASSGRVLDDGKAYPDATVLDAITAGRSGWHRSGDELIVFDRLGGPGWTLVVAGEAEAVLGAGNHP